MLGVEYRSSMPWTVGLKSSNVTTTEPFSWSLVMSKSLSRVVPFERTSDAAPYASGHHCFDQHSSEIQGDFVFFVGNDRNMVAEVAVSLPFEEPLVCDFRHTVDVKGPPTALEEAFRKLHIALPIVEGCRTGKHPDRDSGVGL